MEKNKMIAFQDKEVRRIWHKDEWYFSVIDIIAILTESDNPRRYWSDLKRKLREKEGFELYDKIVQLKLQSPDEKKYLTDCANTKSLFRIIQSIPSKKAEPFKLWLARVGYERVQEIEDPELGQDRIKKYYELKGYPKSWIDKRLRGISIRQELTDEWRNRKVEENREFAILTNEISQATFGMNVKEYKKHKSIKKENLRDHMSDWELIFTMIGEKATTDITKERNSQGFTECKSSAKDGGETAKEARQSVEKGLGKSTISKGNFLPKKKSRKELR
jgi:hypothetical protein